MNTSGFWEKVTKCWILSQNIVWKCNPRLTTVFTQDEISISILYHAKYVKDDRNMETFATSRLPSTFFNGKLWSKVNGAEGRFDKQVYLG